MCCCKHSELSRTISWHHALLKVLTGRSASQQAPQFAVAAHAAAKVAEFRKLCGECGFGTELAGDLLSNCGGDVAAATAALQQLAFGESAGAAPARSPAEQAAAALEGQSPPGVATGTQEDEGASLWDALPPDCRREGVHPTALSAPVRKGPC